jgi:hypothetical protein
MIFVRVRGAGRDVIPGLRSGASAKIVLLHRRCALGYRPGGARTTAEAEMATSAGR